MDLDSVCLNVSKTILKSGIRRLTESADIKEEELSYLFDTKLISERDFESCADHIDKRAPYLVELLSEYAYDDFTDYTKFCFLFQTSSQHPITENEKLELGKIKKQCYFCEIRLQYEILSNPPHSTECQLSKQFP